MHNELTNKRAKGSAVMKAVLEILKLNVLVLSMRVIELNTRTQHTQHTRNTHGHIHTHTHSTRTAHAQHPLHVGG